MYYARIDSSGTPPVDTFLGRGRVEISKPPTIVREKPRQRQKGLGGHHEKPPYGNRRGAPGVNFGGQWPQPISHGSFLRIVTSLTRPVSAACPPNLFPIPYSLFPKNARYRYCGVNGCKDLSPPCQRGVVLPLAKPGGFPRLTGFHIGLFSQEVPAVNPSQKSKIFASSLWQGSLLGA